MLNKTLKSLSLLLAMGISAFSGCATDLVGDPCDLTKLESPTGMAVHPNGRYAYVIGSNFDLDYRATDGGALYVVDLENNALMPSSKRMGSFASGIVLSSDNRHGYAVTRDDDALVWFEISEDGSTISCPNDPESSSLLKCRIILDDDPTHLAITHSYRETTKYENGQNVTKLVEFDLLMIAQLRNARVTAVTVQQDSNGEMQFSKETASFVYSASEVQWIGGERFAVTGRSATSLAIVSPAITEDGKVEGLYARQSLIVPSGYGVYQGRGMTMNPAGDRLYLLNQYPKSLLSFDITGLAKDDSATDKAQMTEMLTLPSDMLKVIWIGDNDTGVLYLSSVVNDAIYIVDPRKMEIIDVVSVEDGPYDFALKDNSLYIVNFLGESISEYDVSNPLAPVKIKDLFKTAE